MQKTCLINKISDYILLRSDWEHVGGQFWLVQEEILRFAVLYLFRLYITNSMCTSLWYPLVYFSFLLSYLGSFQLAGFELLVASANIRHQLLDILPRQLPSYITHKQVIHKINCLRVEFQWLLDEINSSSRKDAEVCLLNILITCNHL